MTAALVAPTPIASAPKDQKVVKRTRRVQAIKRKGAKVEEEEGDEEESGKVAGEDPAASDTDSDFSPQDESEEDDENDSVDPPAPSAAVLPTPPAPTPTTPAATAVPAAGAAKPFAGFPSWSDSPAVGELGADDLPVLDFATLTPAALEAVPIVIKGSAAAAAGKTATSKVTPVDGPSKKALLLAKKEAKSAAAKEKDPVAWEAAEVLRKERELEKKKEKRERTKERNKEKRAAVVAEAGAAVVPAPTVAVPAPVVKTGTTLIPSPSTSTPILPPTGPRAARIPRTIALSRPSRTAVSLGLAAAESASTSTLPPRNNLIALNKPAVNRPVIATAPSLTSRFTSQDARLDQRNAVPEERGVNPFGRGRGRGGVDGSRGGYAGRGGVERGSARGGRGGRSSGGHVNGGDGWGEEDKLAATTQQTRRDTARISDKEQDEDDRWGRGEQNREIKSSITPANFPDAATGWKHDAYEDEASRPSSRGRGGMQGGGRGRGGSNVNAGATERPVPGSINPKYANLPFHPHHRFPGAIPSKASLPAGATNSRPSAGDSRLFDQSSNVVRLPGAVAIPVSAPVVTAPVIAVVVPAPVEVIMPEVVVNMGPSTVAPPRAPSPVPAPHVPEPERVFHQPEYTSAPPPFQQQQALPPSSSYHPPPHLQSQSNSYAVPPPQQHQQQQYIPRHASPAFYPQYYSPDSFNMPTPGGTPPPLFPGPQPGTFFVPPRQSKIEIKAPRPGMSPSSYPKSALSASGDAFAPRQSGAYPGSYQTHGSPVSSRDGMISPSPVPYGYGGGGGGGGGGGYGQQSTGGMEGYIPVESGGIVYFVKPTQQMQAPTYYDPYSNGGYSQQQVDPAILSMSNGAPGQYYPQQQQRSSFYPQQMMQNGGGGQSFPLPPPAQYRSDGY